jgi:hypothetical protein
LGEEDPDGNQLWVITCMKANVIDYVKVLKKTGFQCTEFEYNMKAYLDNHNLRCKLEQDLATLQHKILQLCYHNFGELF